MNQQVVLGMLEDVGISAQVANNGRIAVEMLEETSTDLILMDMQMPEMDGLTATRIIRLMPGHGRVPIIALTANAFAEDKQRCLEAGMNDHLGKPIIPEAFYAMLLKWLPTNARAT